MDGASRFRILLGTVAVLVAVMASLALLNVLLEEPLPLGDGDGDDGGQPGGSGNPFQPPDDGGTDGGDGQQGDGGGGERNKNPCDVAEPTVQGLAIGFTLLAMLMWVIAVWWRQKKATRVMNAWAIVALVLTLIAVTALFAWWIVHKVCSLDVFDLKSCLEIAHSLRNAFILFLVPAVGLLAFAIVRKRGGKAFWGLWSGAGLVFAYLAVLALAGWLVAEDLCEKQFEEPDIEPPDGGDGDGGDGGNGTDGSDGGDGGSDPGTGGDSGGGGSGSGGGRGSGGGGRSAPSVPQVSPFFLLVILGIAAVIVVIVLAFKGRQDKMKAIAAGQMDISGRGGVLSLFTETDLESNDRVVAAYRRFLDHCRVYGVPKKPQETPREHGERAADQLDLDFETMKELIDAYALIRLGARDATPEQRAEAIRISRNLQPKTVRARKVRKGGPA